MKYKKQYHKINFWLADLLQDAFYGWLSTFLPVTVHKMLNTFDIQELSGTLMTNGRTLPGDFQEC